MYSEKHIDELKSLHEQLKDLLRETETVDFYNTWADTFQIEEINEKQVVVGYYGKAPIKRFKKECEEILWANICIIAGYKESLKIKKSEEGNRPIPDVKFVKNNATKIENVKVKNNIKAFKFLVIGLIFAFIAACIGIITCNYIVNRNFRETFYNVSSLKVDNRIRVIQLSDLHNCNYGQKNKKLIDRVKKLQPDIIICTGDMVESAKNDTTGVEQLGKQLSEIAPSYYIYGNNEVESVYDFLLNQNVLDEKFGFNDDNRDETKLLEIEDSLKDKLQKSGFKVLKNQKDTLTVGTTEVDVYGVLTSNPSSFWTYTEKSFSNYIYEETDNLKITAIHEPFIFEEFEPDFWGDLMICGHTHGGEIRVPILGPLYTREHGIFPQRRGYFVYGRRDVSGRPLIVSSGLDNSNLLRINNQPELVIIDINKF